MMLCSSLRFQREPYSSRHKQNRPTLEIGGGGIRRVSRKCRQRMYSVIARAESARGIIVNAQRSARKATSKAIASLLTIYET